MGLGYEISSVARAGLLSAHNSVYVQLVRLGSAWSHTRWWKHFGLFLLFRNRAAAFIARGKSRVGGQHEVLRELGSFLDATGWTLIWGLNLGNGSLENAIAEAKAVTAAAKKSLLAFEIGNEPDLFPRRESHRHTAIAMTTTFSDSHISKRAAESHPEYSLRRT